MLFQAKPKQGDNVGTENNCPPQPKPVDLPSPLPQAIQEALNKLDNLVSSNVDQVALVKFL